MYIHCHGDALVQTSERQSEKWQQWLKMTEIGQNDKNLKWQIEQMTKDRVKKKTHDKVGSKTHSRCNQHNY